LKLRKTETKTTQTGKIVSSSDIRKSVQRSCQM